MPIKTEVNADLLAAAELGEFAKQKWNGDKVLFDAVRAYQTAVVKFCKKNNLDVANLCELKYLQHPETYLQRSSYKPKRSGSSRDAAEKIGLAEKAGRVATTTRVSRVKTAAVTKRVAKKSK